MLMHPTTNLGKQACSNLRIIKKTMSCVFRGDADLIIIAFTNPERTDFIDKQGVFSVWPGRNIQRLEYTRAKIINYINEIYVEGKTVNWYQRNWLRDVILLQNFLQQNNQKYIMVQSHMSQWNNYVFKDQNLDLTSKIDTTYFVGWPYDGFTEWAHGSKEGPGGHFLEDGHKIVAEKIYAYIGRFGWFS